MTSVRALFVGLTLAFSFVAHGLGSVNAQASAPPIVILISIDGWRWDYLQLFAPPTLSRLASRGVRAEGLIPVFPSKTFPNHYSIVTGQYPARHGILSNNLVDDALPGRFSLSQRDRWVQQDTRWWLDRSWSNIRQFDGRRPPISTSDPGQNIVPVRCP